jgi:hypothetical protein
MSDSMSYSMSERVMKVVGGVYEEGLRDAVEKLASIYKFDGEEAMKLFGEIKYVVGVKSVKEKSGGKKKKSECVPSLPLPFCGVVDDEKCNGIRLNHGLHTQCPNEKEGLGEYCKTCQKHADKNASGKPNHGDIRDRLECGLLEYRDPKGRQTIPYGNVVAKLGLDKEACMREAEKFGMTIPEEHWQVMEKKRGRPKKSVTGVSDTSSEKSEPKRRGRPKKTKKVESAVGDDLLAQLKAADDDSNSDISGEEQMEQEKSEANAAKKAEKKRKAELKQMRTEEKESKSAEKAAAKAAKEAEKKRKAEEKAAAKAAKEAEKKRKEEEKAAAKAAKEAEKKRKEEEAAAASELGSESESEDEENEVDAERFEFEGKTYFKTSDNLLYEEDAMGSDDPEPIGMWDEANNKIQPVEVMSDDEEEDDE